MKKNNIERNHFENIEKILPLQECPFEAIEWLENIVSNLAREDPMWIATKAYCLGVIVGKREGRLQHVQGSQQRVKTTAQKPHKL